MNMTRFSLPQLPDTQQRIRKHSAVKGRSPEVLFSTLQESFSGPPPVCPCVSKKVLVSLVIWFPCPGS